MIRALVADDEAPARQKLARWLAAEPDIELAGAVADGLAAAQAIETLRPDVAFLDIQMPGMTGLEVAAQLEQSAAPLLVFVTAYDEHAVRAFDLNAVDYLLKPYDQDRLTRTLERVRFRMNSGPGGSSAVQVARAQTNSSERLLAPLAGELRIVDAAAIEWLEADDNYVHVHTAEHKYLLRRTLQDLLAQLGEVRFARIHRSAAVNLAEIQSLAPLFKGDYEVRLRRGQVLRLSRRYKEALFARLPR